MFFFESDYCIEILPTASYVYRKPFANEFEFSVTNDSIAAIFECNNGKIVELRYKEYLHTLPWRGMSNFIVIEVISAK
ncbi:MAG: hypothetical protein A2066_00405 [Bacteroidetes bacterium GWB2_41_8]|nr:MAG: hypothetical protein A2066_00405 [Bacteroidetes bacterium GWB2_41_8]